MGSAQPSSLTPREREVMDLIGRGATVEEVAGALGIRPGTVAKHKQRVFQKLDVQNQTAALAELRRTAGPAGSDNGHAPAPAVSADGGGTEIAVAVDGHSARLRRRVERTVASLPGIRPAAEGDHDVMVLVDPSDDDWGLTPAPRPVVVVTAGEGPRSLVDALARGANVVLSAEDLDDLRRGIEVAANGEVVLRPGQAKVLADALGTFRAAWAQAGLTARQRQLLQLICDGATTRQIARRLGISEKTVENSQGRLFRKLGVRNRAAAVAKATSLGLLAS